MIQLNTLLEQNKTNFYKLLVIIDNNSKKELIINQLIEQGWNSFDINDIVLNLLENIQEEDAAFEISHKIKEWVMLQSDKLIFYNNNILYSPELGKPNPIESFKYKARNKEIIIFLEGKKRGDKIYYSEYGKQDYTEMDISELICVNMEEIDV